MVAMDLAKGVHGQDWRVERQVGEWCNCILIHKRFLRSYPQALIWDRVVFLDQIQVCQLKGEISSLPPCFLWRSSQKGSHLLSEASK